MAKKDYYETLGIHKNADEKGIKQAYRKLAKKYHPDTNPGDKQAEQKFKEITEAYNVLSDKEKKKMYDQYGFAAFEEGMGSRGFTGDFRGGASQSGGNYGGFGNGGNYQEFHFEGSNVDDIFGDLFGNIFNGGTGNEFKGNYQSGFTGQQESGFTGQSGRRTANKKGADAHSDITISFEEAAFGCDKTFQIHGQDGTQSLKVHIPAGIDAGKSIRLQGKGSAGIGSGRPGDLFLKVHIREKNGYERKGTDVYTTANIPYTTAVLGGEAQVQTIHGDVMCKIPAGTQSGSKIRLRGKGIVSMKNANVYGDEYVTIQIQVPRHVNQREKELLMECEKIRQRV